MHVLKVTGVYSAIIRLHFRKSCIIIIIIIIFISPIEQCFLLLFLNKNKFCCSVAIFFFGRSASAVSWFRNARANALA